MEICYSLVRTVDPDEATVGDGDKAERRRGGGRPHRRSGVVAVLLLLATAVGPLSAGAVERGALDRTPPSMWETASKLVDDGDYAAGRAAYEAKLALLLAERETAGATDRLEAIAFLHRKIAVLLESEGRPREAIDHYRELVAVRATILAADPGDGRRVVQLAWARMLLGEMLHYSRDARQGRDQLAEAEATIAPWMKNGPPVRLRRTHAAILAGLADAEGSLDDHDSAARHFGEAVALQRDVLRQAPSDEEDQEELARILRLSAIERLDRGDTSAAMGELRESRNIRLGLVHRAPDDLDRRARLANTIGQIARARQNAGETAAAAADYREAIDHLEIVVTARLEDMLLRRQLMQFRIRLADCLDGDTLERALLYRKAIGLADRLLAVDPSDPIRRKDRADAIRELGWFDEYAERYAEALDSYEVARDVLQDLVDEDPTSRDRRTDLASVHDDLGDALYGMKSNDEARWAYRRAYDITEALVAEDAGDLARSHLAHFLRKLALVDAATGHANGARESLGRADVLLQLDAVAHPDNAWIAKERKRVADQLARLSEKQKP